MENENKERKENPNPPLLLSVSIIIAAVIIAIGLYSRPASERSAKNLGEPGEKVTVNYSAETLPPSVAKAGVELPVVWGDLGARLASVGAIDAAKFKALYQGNAALSKEAGALLSDNYSGKLKITPENSGVVLNLLWALGLASSNPILDSGEMTNKAYGGAQNFASTAGWTIAKGNPMDHYSRHKFFSLTSEEQALVDKVSHGIYRPCCNNSTHFPDCNHGMAMLGLLELLASQGASEQDMWKTALTVNSYWFPDTYITIASYMKNRGVLWKDVNPKEILGINYSSASGFARIASQVVEPSSSQGGSGCGVEAGGSAPALQQRQQTGCGI